MIAIQREILAAVSRLTDSQTQLVGVAKRWMALEEHKNSMVVKATMEASQSTSLCQLCVNFQLYVLLLYYCTILLHSSNARYSTS